MSIEELVREHWRVAGVGRRGGEEGLHLWYADLGLEVNGEHVNYSCPQCGASSGRTIHEFVYCDSNAALICGTCRGDVDERAGALD